MSFSRYIDGSRVVYWDDTTGNLTIPGAITASTFLGASFSLGPSVQFSSIQCSSINAGTILNGSNTATLAYTNTTAPASDGKVNGINITNLNQRVRPSYGEQLLFTSSMSWTTWASRTPAANYGWRQVAWSPTLKMYCAVANDNTRNNNIMTSPDGINWTLRTMGIGPDLAVGVVIWADTIGRFVAIGDNGVNVFSLYSSDGINWFRGGISTNAFWIDLAWSPQLGRMVAVGWRPGTPSVAYSDNGGVNWTVITPGVTSRWYGICWAAELRLFVAVGPFADAGANRCVMTSPDGETWTHRLVPATKDWFSIAWSGELGLFAAVSRSGTADTLGVMTSPDGVNWTLRSTPAFIQFAKIIWSPELSMFVVSNLNNASLLVSRDGVTWTSYPVLPVARQIYGMVWSREQSKLVLVDTNTGAPGSYVFTSEPALPASQNTLLFASPGYASVNNSNGLISMSSMNISSATARALTVYSINPSDSNVRFGSNTAFSNPGSNTVAIGQSAGFSNQGNHAIAIGRDAGVWSQGSNAVAIGYSAGNSNQAAWGVAIGLNAGASNQSNFGISIGFNAGYFNQGLAATAFGPNCGFSNQGNYAFAGGDVCGYFSQGPGAVAIGRAAGYSNQGIYSIAIGSNAGSNNQSSFCVAIGLTAGEKNQNAFATAIGYNAGNSNQGIAASAFGPNAGAYNQGFRAVAIGDITAYSNQGCNAVAVGASAGQSNQGNYAVSLGYNAGRTSQGSNAIAIGNMAGETSQVANSIILNASNVALNAATNAGFYVNPVRNVETDNVAFYDTTTKEVSYGSPRFAQLSTVNVSSAVVATSTINTNTISSAIASFSTINTNTLIVNFVNVVSTSVANVDTLNATNVSSAIVSTSTINTNTISSAIGRISTVNTQNVSSAVVGTSTINTNTISSAVANISTINTQNVSSVVVNTSTINTNTISTTNLSFMNGTASQFNTSTAIISTLFLGISTGTYSNFATLAFNGSSIITNRSIVPSIDNTYSLGLSTMRYKDIFIGPGTVYIGSSTFITENVLNISTVSTQTINNVLFDRIPEYKSNGLFIRRQLPAAHYFSSTIDVINYSTTFQDATVSADTIFPSPLYSSTFYASPTNVRFSSSNGPIYFENDSYIGYNASTFETVLQFTFSPPILNQGYSFIFNGYSFNVPGPDWSFTLNTELKDKFNNIIFTSSANAYNTKATLGLIRGLNGFSLYTFDNYNTATIIYSSDNVSYLNTNKHVQFSPIYRIPFGTLNSVYEFEYNEVENNISTLQLKEVVTSSIVGLSPRNATAADVIYYNSVTKELTYGAAPGGGGTVSTFNSVSTATASIGALNVSSIGGFSPINIRDALILNSSIVASTIITPLLNTSTLKANTVSSAMLITSSINLVNSRIILGSNAGYSNQGGGGIAIGIDAGYENQGVDSICIGTGAGYTSQGSNTVSIGFNAGSDTQGASAVAIGNDTGANSQGSNAVAIGYFAGRTNQGANAVSLGRAAGNTNQAANAVAIGYDAGKSNQSPDTVAVGVASGYYNQSSNAIAVGSLAGYSNQASNAVAVGNYAGFEFQGIQAVAIGSNAGRTSQGSNAIAIGNGAGETNQVANSIILNASNVPLNAATNAGFYVNPVRSATATNVMYYDTTTKEITYSSPPAVTVVSTFNSLSSGTASIGALNVSSIGGFSPIYFKDAIVADTISTLSTSSGVSIIGKQNVSSTTFGFEKQFNDFNSLSYISTSGVSATATGFIRTASGGGWTETVRTTTGFGTTAYVSASPSAATYMSFGLTSAPPQVSTEIQYEWYFDSGSVKVYTNSVLRATVAYLTSNKYEIWYDGTNIKFLMNGSVVWSEARALGATLYFNASFFLENAELTNLFISPFINGLMLGATLSYNSTFGAYFDVPVGSFRINTGLSTTTMSTGSASIGKLNVSTIAFSDNTNIINLSTTFSSVARETNQGWYSVASSTDGTKLVATVLSGQIYTSTDSGLSWTARETNRSWVSVASSADGTKLVAVDQFGQIYTSTDSGVSWTARESNRFWTGVTSSADGMKLVAVGSNERIYTSTDGGVSWTARESSRNWSSVASSADGTKLVAVVGLGLIYTSTDSGLSWTARESNREWKDVASSDDGTKLVAVVNGGQIYTSTDSGVSWTPRDYSGSWRSVSSSADGTKLVAVVMNGYIYTSADSGVSWTTREYARYWSSVASSADGTKLVAVVQGGQIHTIFNGIIINMNTQLSVGELPNVTSGTNVLTYDVTTKEIKYNTAKTFVIDHPHDPSRLLVHGCLEGPEAGVYYRGSSCIPNNSSSITVSIPAYATAFRDFTIQVTPIWNGTAMRALNVSRMSADGTFTVFGEPGEFDWHVHGSRAAIEVEPRRADVDVHGDGPYRWIAPAASA